MSITSVETIVTLISKVTLGPNVRGGADKSLARSGMKQATATKLGVYSAYSHEAQYTS